jgi:hypothetical protein
MCMYIYILNICIYHGHEKTNDIVLGRTKGVSNIV